MNRSCFPFVIMWEMHHVVKSKWWWNPVFVRPIVFHLHQVNPPLKRTYGQADCELQTAQTSVSLTGQPSVCVKAYVQKWLKKPFQAHSLFQSHIHACFFSPIKYVKDSGWNIIIKIHGRPFFLYFGSQSSRMHLSSPPLWGWENIWQVTGMALRADVIG